MTTAWFQKEAGSEIHEGIEDETMVLVGSVVPDWVRLPAELGGARVPVEGASLAPCPMCGGGPDVQHLGVEGNLGVAECRHHGFVWYRKSV